MYYAILHRKLLICSCSRTNMFAEWSVNLMKVYHLYALEFSHVRERIDIAKNSVIVRSCDGCERLTCNFYSSIIAILSGNGLLRWFNYRRMLSWGLRSRQYSSRLCLCPSRYNTWQRHFDRLSSKSQRQRNDRTDHKLRGL